MSEEEIVALICEVLEVVVEEHKTAGRHEINRTDVARAIERVRLLGLPKRV